MAMPANLPAGLTDEFSGDASRQALWQAFTRKNGLETEPLPGVVARLRRAWNDVMEPGRR